MVDPRAMDGPDAVFHVTARVNWQFWHLAEEGRANTFLALLERYAREFEINLLSSVLMSNHYHFVCQSPGAERYRELTSRTLACRHRRSWPKGHLKSRVISQFMHKLMFTASRAIQQQLDLKGRFWDDSYHARRLEDAFEMLVAIAYDHLNPVRQKMVGAPEDYPRSSAGWWAGTGESRISLLTRGLPFGLHLETFRERLLAYHSSRTFADAIEALAEAGLPLGDPEAGRLLRSFLREEGFLT